MKRSDKKGLSPVIASSLMILLVFVLAFIVFLWAKGFIGERIEKFGKPVEEYCDRVSFDAARDGSMLEILNKGSVDIRHFDIKKFRGGNSETARFDFQVDAGGSKEAYVQFDMANGDTPDKVIIYPALIGSLGGSGSNSVFTCIDSGVTL